MLDEIELLVAGGRPEVVAFVGERLAVGLALLVDDGHAALLAERRIGQHHVEALAGVGDQAVVDHHRRSASLRSAAADAMQVEVHHAQAGGVVDDLPAAEGLVAQGLLLVAVELVVVEDVIVGSQEKAAGTAGRIADRHAGLGAQHLHHGLDQRARGEVLTRAALDVFGVFLQQALVDLAFDVDIEPDPGLLVDHRRRGA